MVRQVSTSAQLQSLDQARVVLGNNRCSGVDRGHRRAKDSRAIAPFRRTGRLAKAGTGGGAGVGRGGWEAAPLGPGQEAAAPAPEPMAAELAIWPAALVAVAPIATLPGLYGDMSTASSPASCSGIAAADGPAGSSDVMRRRWTGSGSCVLRPLPRRPCRAAGMSLASSTPPRAAAAAAAAVTALLEVLGAVAGVGAAAAMSATRPGRRARFREGNSGTTPTRRGS